MVIRAVRALLEDEPYKSRFSFALHNFESPEGKHAQELYAFGGDRHGLVVLDRTGAVLALRPGHSYDQSEIQDDFDRILQVD